MLTELIVMKDFSPNNLLQQDFELRFLVHEFFIIRNRFSIFKPCIIGNFIKTSTHFIVKMLPKFLNVEQFAFLHVDKKHIYFSMLIKSFPQMK